jgi:hypothetical protein
MHAICTTAKNTWPSFSYRVATRFIRFNRPTNRSAFCRSRYACLSSGKTQQRYVKFRGSG